MGYEGFISYSHAADDLLAPRLQSALQRFAKPWWKRRALRVFRDESSLSANPHLWESIAAALDESEWFLLLLSPEAAASEWVGEEIAYWVDHKDVGRILPVVTAGSFGWDGDVAGDSVPEALRGAFSAEPRWVDLRFAKGETQLDLKDPRFADAVADLASAMRGVPKDDLAGEEVRQHRRTVRTAWAAGGLLVVFAVVAVWAGVMSARNADEARANAAQARTSADAEAEARALAEEQALLAEANAEEADTQRRQALEEAERADRTSRRLIESVLERNWFEVDPPGRAAASFENAPLSLSLVESPPDSTRLDFLQDHETQRQTLGNIVMRIPGFIDEERGLRTGDNAPYTTGSWDWTNASAWLADEPFHVRHGFPLPPGEEVSDFYSPVGRTLQLYVTREIGPPGSWVQDGLTYLFFAEAVVLEESSACGPNYRDQVEPVECLRWVFDFPEGLPAGRYDLWLQWLAPCGEWFTSAAPCPSEDMQVSFFEFGATIAFVAENFVNVSNNTVDWPFDPWELADPIPEPPG